MLMNIAPTIQHDKELLIYEFPGCRLLASGLFYQRRIIL